MLNNNSHTQMGNHRWLLISPLPQQDVVVNVLRVPQGVAQEQTTFIRNQFELKFDVTYWEVLVLSDLNRDDLTHLEETLEINAEGSLLSWDYYWHRWRATWEVDVLLRIQTDDDDLLADTDLWRIRTRARWLYLSSPSLNIWVCRRRCRKSSIFRPSI